MAEDLEDDLDDLDGGEGGGEGEAQEQKGPNKKKLILFIAIPVLLVLGVAAGAYFTGLADPLLHALRGEKKEAAEGAAETGSKEVHPAVFYELPEILVNLNTTGRKQTFLKIKVSLELEKSADVARVEQVMPRIIDNFQVYLRELRLEDLQGSAGLLRLREELLIRVNNAARPAKVNDVLFKEMLVQ